MIGWEDDEETIEPIALKAEEFLLRAIPHIMPHTEMDLYRFVLEHGDFGIHNISITKNMNDEPFITSLYDWETACIVPTNLFDSLVKISPIDLITDEEEKPRVTHISQKSTTMDLETYTI